MFDMKCTFLFAAPAKCISFSLHLPNRRCGCCHNGLSLLWLYANNTLSKSICSSIARHQHSLLALQLYFSNPAFSISFNRLLHYSIGPIPIAAMVVDIVEVYGPGRSFYLPGWAGSKGKVVPPTTTAEEKQSPIEVSCQQATVFISGMSDLLIRRALSRDTRKL